MWKLERSFSFVLQIGTKSNAVFSLGKRSGSLFVLQKNYTAWGSLVCLSDVVCSPGQRLEAVTAIVLFVPPSWIFNFTRNWNTVARSFLENTVKQTVSAFHNLPRMVPEVTERTVCCGVRDIHGNHRKCAEKAVSLYFSLRVSVILYF